MLVKNQGNCRFAAKLFYPFNINAVGKVGYFGGSIAIAIQNY